MTSSQAHPGITLAISSDVHRAQLLALLTKLPESGKAIAFDPDYCAALWRNRDPVHLTVITEPNPKDTTGAGDSFAGTYLAERVNGSTVKDAPSRAAQVAQAVVQHPGAIINAEIYREASQQDY